MLGYLFTADLTSAIIVAVTLPLIPLFMALVGWYTDRQTRAKWQALARLAGHFSDVIAGLPTLKVFGRARAQAAAVRRVTEDYRKASMVTLRVAFLSSMVLELLASLSVALVAVAIGLRLVYGELTLEVGLAVLMLAPGGIPAAAPARHPVPRRRGRRRRPARRCWRVLDTPVPAPGTRTDVPALPGLRLDGVAVGEAGGARRGRTARPGRSGRPGDRGHRGQRGRQDHAAAAAGRSRCDPTPGRCVGHRRCRATVRSAGGGLAGRRGAPGWPGRRRAPCSRPAPSARTSCWERVPARVWTTTGCGRCSPTWACWSWSTACRGAGTPSSARPGRG